MTFQPAILAQSLQPRLVAIRGCLRDRQIPPRRPHLPGGVL